MPEEFLEVPIDDLIPSDYQLHIHVPEEEFDRLVQSIKDVGQQERIVCKRVGNKFKILSGNTRYVALKAAGVKTAKIVVVDVESPEEEIKRIYHANVRVKINPIDEARFFQQALKLYMGNIDKMADDLGIRRNYIRERLALLEYPKDVQEAVLRDEIPLSVAKWLAKIDHDAARANYLNAACLGGMTEAVARRCYEEYRYRKESGMPITPQVIEEVLQEAEQYLITPCDICGCKIKIGEEGHLWGHKECLNVAKELVHQKLAEMAEKEQQQQQQQPQQQQQQPTQ